MTRLDDDSSLAHADALLLLPWYATGKLSESASRKVRQHLSGCEHCNSDLTLQLLLKDFIGGTPAIDYAPQASLHKLLDRIEVQESRRIARKRRWMSRMRAPWSVEQRRSARGWIRGLAIAAGMQAAAIVVLLAAVGWLAVRSAPPASYRTLTSVAEAPSMSGPSVRVVFDESLSVGALQSLLQSIDARIVAGPTSTGAYRIQLNADGPDTTSAVATAEWLRAQRGVRFAEPVHRE